uniref:hypothetical protein n=1 Tax=Actinomyces urogenitalis TaxID=103621 RepID=UPI0019552523
TTYSVHLEFFSCLVATPRLFRVILRKWVATSPATSPATSAKTSILVATPGPYRWLPSACRWLPPEGRWLPPEGRWLPGWLPPPDGFTNTFCLP